MVHMRATNAKLSRRAAGIVSRITGHPTDEAVRFVDEAKGDVKIAMLLALGTPVTVAASLLERHDGNLRAAIAEIRADRDG
jgi:N-acetylmuramic acid 6-phosphate etherase